MTNIYPNLKLSEVISKTIFLMDNGIDFRVEKDELAGCKCNHRFTVRTVDKDE